MIRLSPRPPAPAALARRAAPHVAAVAAAVAAGERPVFEPAWRHPEVKAALHAWQHGKCAFCEASIAATQHGDVEHYRPKGGVAEEDGAPGYWWLAYDWSNLLLACQICNQAFKRDRFPLGDGGRRARSPADPLDAEAPLLLDPASDAPGDHLRWAAECVVGTTARGTATIELVGLDREPLVEERLRHWQLVGTLVRLWQATPTPEVGAVLTASTRPDAPFSAMARAMVPPELHG